MTQVLTCSQCSATIPPDAPGGVCPACVLQLAGSEGAPWNVTAAYGATPTLPSLTDLATLFPQLEIVELIGRGGMGAVYKARQPSLDRFVALKILLPDIGKDPTFAERFSREARALARLNHPHIVSVYDSGHVGGLYFFIMEYVDGVNLRQAIQAEQISPEKALAIVPQICEALQYAHEEGVVHRDIKPENVLLDRKGRVKVADFGLAKLLGLATPDITLTGTRQAMGTLHYMAPEQYERPQAVDHRADIYSLGVVFYELLTGKLPLGRFALPSEKVHVDVRLDDVVLKSLEREPERRYQYVSEVKTEMDSIAHSPAPAVAQRAHPTVFAAGRAMHAPPPTPRTGLTDLGRLLAVLGGIALAMMPLLCVLGVFASYIGVGVYSLRIGVLGGIAVGVLLLVAGAILLAWGLSLRQPASDPEGIPPEKAPDAARRQRERAEIAVRLPGFALLILGVIDCALILAVGVLMGDGFGRFPDVMVLSAVLVQLAAAITICVGGTLMRNLRSYRLAMAAAVVALVPIHFAWLLGLPIGIWALAVLCRSDVRAAFGIARPAPADPSRKAVSLAAVLVMIIAAMFFIPMLLLCGLFFGWTTVSKAPSMATVETYQAYPPDAATKSTEPRPGEPEGVEWIDGQPQLGRSIPQFAGLLLDEDQMAAINKALLESHSDYLKIEKEHTRRTTNELGHQVVTVSPFPKELTRLEDSFWTKVDSVVTDDSTRGTLRQQLSLRTLFPYGQYDYSVEIWKVGAWYSFTYPQFGGQPSKVPELPVEIKRFWEPPAGNDPMTNDQ